MRLFIAIRLSDEMKKQLVHLMHNLRKSGTSGNFAHVQNLHLTLCFIGETTEAEKIKRIMEEIRFRPFRLSLSGMGRFGDLLWAGADGGKELYALADQIRAKLQAQGIRTDGKEFHPHITLLRRMTGTDGTAFPAPSSKMKVREIFLMRSDRIHGRMVYTSIYSVSASQDKI